MKNTQIPYQYTQRSMNIPHLCVLRISKTNLFIKNKNKLKNPLVEAEINN